MLDGVWQFAVEQIMVVGLSTMGAAITATLPQFAVVAVAAVLFTGMLIGQARPFIQQLPTLPLAGSSSPLANWAVVTVVGASAVLVYRSARRRVVRAAVAATGVLVVGVLGAFTVRPPFDAVPPAPIREGVLEPAAVGLDVEALAVRVESGSTNDARGRQVRYRYTGAFLRTSGEPPAIVLQPWSIASTWHPGKPRRSNGSAGAAPPIGAACTAKRMMTDSLSRALSEPWEASSC